MSTSKTAVMMFAIIYSKANRNGRSIENYGTPQEAKAIQQSMATEGWQDQYPALVELIPPAEREAAIKECLAERKARLDAVKASGDLALRDVLEKLYIGKGGKWVEPTHYRVSGFRRAANYEVAMTQRVELLKKLPKKDEDGENALDADEGTEVYTSVPVIVKTFANDLERLFEQQMENELPNRGRSAVVEKDKLRITQKLVSWGANGNDIKKLYGSIGQKYYGLVKCNDFWPALRIFDRCLLADEDSSAIPIKSVKHEKTSNYTARHRNDAKGANRDSKLLPIAEQEVREYFESLKDKTPATPMLGKTDIRDMSESNDITLVRLAMGAVLNNDKSQLVALANGKDALNSATELVMAGNGSIAQLALSYAKDRSEVLIALDNAFRSGASVETILAAIKTTWTTPAVATA